MSNTTVNVGGYLVVDLLLNMLQVILLLAIYLGIRNALRELTDAIDVIIAGKDRP